MKLYVVHWHANEAAALVAPLRDRNYDIQLHTDTNSTTKWGALQFDAVVISLERLPSHGQAIAEWVWSAKKRQSIPILFVGGTPEKVHAVQQQFPTATYCEVAALPKVLEQITTAVRPA